ncbi:hypothetical protein PSCFBP3800_02746 [Pseudomonas syringae group genomosp. 3]|nr:hypothetical protein PSCFBP3800_02746 [Pseudomonas syringae group genomosp. 3]
MKDHSALSHLFKFEETTSHLEGGENNTSGVGVTVLSGYSLDVEHYLAGWKA